jgi:hypothetical protein
MPGPPSLSVVAPRYGQAALSDLLPSIMAAMGVSAFRERAVLPVPPADRVCLFVADGLGLELLATTDVSDAPFLRSLLDQHSGSADQLAIDAGFPSSTPVSLCSVGTGRTPGEHGIVGFAMHVPPVPEVFECLTWMRYGGGIDLIDTLPPEVLQPCEPLFGVASSEGVEATVVSLDAHIGTGLTRAAFRGAAFDSIPALDDLGARLRIVSRLLAGVERAFVYTYDVRLDAAAHVSGVGSREWLAALQATDALAAGLAGVLPDGAMLIVTGDHGAVNVPPGERVDLASRPDLARDVAFLSGDPRTRHVHAAPGGADGLCDTWREGLGEGWLVLSREEVVAAGLLGPTVRDDVLARIGDVVAIALGAGGIFDGRRFPWELRLAGFHGALTPAELRVPFLVHRA